MNENEIDLFKLDFSLFFSMKKSILKKLNLFLFPLFISNLCMAMNPKWKKNSHFYYLISVFQTCPYLFEV